MNGNSPSRFGPPAWVIFWLWGTMISWAQAQPVEPEMPVLDSVQEIRSLTVAEAKKGRFVRLAGTVIYSRSNGELTFVHDGSNGIFVDRPANREMLNPGDRVELQGITGEGLFAPVIRLDPANPGRLRVLGSGSLPSPMQVSGDELSLPTMDCEWVSVEARVLDVMINRYAVILECRAGPCEFNVIIDGPFEPDAVPWDLAESQVRITGVVATAFNTRRQMTRRMIRVNSLADIVPLAPGPTSMTPPKMARADDLLQLAGPGPNDLVRLRGVATLPLPGRGLFLNTPEGGLWIQTAQPIDAVPGTVVEVEGWPRLGEMRPFVRSKRVTIVGKEAPPPPRAIQASEAVETRWESELVSVEAELLDTLIGSDGRKLVLRGSGAVFECSLPRERGTPAPRYQAGSRLRVTGIARVFPVNPFVPIQLGGKLLILTRSADDVVVIASPPWWTTQRVALAAAVLFAAMLGSYALARVRRNREAETKHREYEAVVAERGRFAREIHDSLAQGLTSISLQLECVRDEVGDDSPKLRSHIENARRLVRDSLREARRTVWNLRPLALGEADLVTALQRFATDLARDSGISCSPEIEGNPRPLPAGHDAALLRIGQEAITNVIRHARAGTITMRLRFDSEWVTLTVRDDGDGFDVATPGRKGFGLTGMQERVAALGGSLSIDSMPGEGTEVSATLPT